MYRRLRKLCRKGGRKDHSKPESQGVCCEVVPPCNTRSYTHPVSPGGLPKHELEKEINTHANVGRGKCVSTIHEGNWKIKLYIWIRSCLELYYCSFLLCDLLPGTVFASLVLCLLSCCWPPGHSATRPWIWTLGLLGSFLG